MRPRRLVAAGLTNLLTAGPGPADQILDSGAILMARQVPRRNKLQLILLIVFCILFVIATALAILGLVNYDKATQAYDDLVERKNQLDKENADLRDQSNTLIFKITGKTGTIDKALKDTEIAFEATDEQGGLVPELLLLAGRYKSNVELVNKLNLQIADLQNQLDLQKKAQAELATEKQKDTQAFQDKEAQLNTNLLDEQKKVDKVFDEAKVNVSKTRKELTSTINAQTKQIERLTEDNQIKADEIAKIKDQLERLKKTSMDSGLAIQSDGQIVKIVRDANVCYINKGSEDRVQRGMTFSVYPPSAAGQSGVKEKGSLRVTSTNNTFSECTIVNEEADTPISENDIISSVAYHNTRPQIFVVAGDFDLHNTGRATEADATEVKNAIRRSGGQVAPELTIQTDYVVLGVPPNKPTPPAEDALPANQATYQQQLKRYTEYLALQEKAQTMGIPVLNTNRFIEMTGYKPDRIAE